MAQSLVLLSLAALAGVSVVMQQAINANLRAALGSAVWSAFSSFSVGLVCVTLFALAIRDPVPSATTAARIPWWGWSGGLFGATIIGLGILLVPQLGAATFITAMIAGQLIASMVFDHFGWLGLAERPLDLVRVLGALLLAMGVILIRR